QHLPRVLSNWGAIVPPERIHLIVLPREDGDVWEPFSRVIGAEPGWAPRQTDRRNTSLGSGEATMLRQLNKRLKKVGLDRKAHRSLVLNPIVYEALSQREGDPVVLPPESHEWASGV